MVSCNKAEVSLKVKEWCAFNILLPTDLGNFASDVFPISFTPGQEELHGPKFYALGC